MDHGAWERVPIDAQSVEAPLSRSAVFLVMAAGAGDAALAGVRETLGTVGDLVKNVGFRDLNGRLSCVVGIGSAPNSFLMTRAAEIGRGSFTHIGSADQVEERMRAYPASGEINRRLADPQAALARIEAHYAPQQPRIDRTDGVGLEFPQWRFNLRLSNTEPLVRLNVESRGDRALMERQTAEVLGLLDGA